MKPIRRLKQPVTQEHGTGCAVACVAFALGFPYEAALKFFSRPSQAWGRGFYCKEVVDALIRAGKQYSYRHLNPKKLHVLRIPGTIVYVDSSGKYPLGHYLVRSAQGEWMNPWINFPIIAPAKSGFQKRLPGRALYAVTPIE